MLYPFRCLIIFTILITTIHAVAEPLPPARRVFSLDVDKDGQDELLIAHNTSLSAFRYGGTQTTGWNRLWQIKGPGVVQKVLFDPQFPSLVVAWGMGKGQLKAPITITSVDPLNGHSKQLWTYQGGRSQVVNLQMVQIDQDSEAELFIAHFVSKYHTRRLILDQLSTHQPQEIAVSGQVRMATSWLLANLDGTPGLEEVIGRVYGDEKGEYGDLSVQPFLPTAPQINLGQIIPTARGVKSLKVWPKISANLPDHTALYFSDGWVAAYGKKAKAGLKRLLWHNGRTQVERLADSLDEFTFFDMWYRTEPKSNQSYIFAQGNKGINLLIPNPNGPWQVLRLLKTPPIVNTAIGYAGNQWWAFLPFETGTQVKALKIPVNQSVPVSSQ